MPQHDLEIADQLALRRLAELYALAVDDLDENLFVSLFTPDAVLHFPAGDRQGTEEIRAVIPMVRGKYFNTFHAILNQVTLATPDGAEGETYCIARHLIAAVNGVANYEMNIRYRDSFVRHEGGWRFSRRRLNLQWTSTESAVLWQGLPREASLRRDPDLSHMLRPGSTRT